MTFPLRIGDQYTREQLNELLDTKAFTSSAGLLYPEWQGHSLIVLRVTLEKSTDAVKAGWDYHDYFDGELFHWDSQTTQDINTPKIQEMVNGQSDIHLICRLDTQGSSGATNPFIYCGELLYNDHVPGTANPIHMSFTCLDLVGPQPEIVEALRQWKPSTGHVDSTTLDVGREMQVRSQGYSNDPAYKKAVELRAMGITKEHYETNGFTVVDTSSNHPYDFEVRKHTEIRRVEVKGSAGGLTEINVTANEVRHAQREDVTTDLALVANISFDRDTTTAAGGILRIVKDWTPSEKNLTPTAYRCKVDDASV